MKAIAIRAALVFLLVAFAAHAQDRELIYEIPVDALQRSLQHDPTASLDRTVDACADVLVARAGSDVTVTRRSATTVVVRVPAANLADVPRIRRRIECRGTLEMRMVAATPRNEAETQLDPGAERRRLLAWLDAGGRARVLADAAALDAFHGDAERGPIARGQVAWVVHRIRRAADDPKLWTNSLRTVPAFADVCVPLFDEAQWNAGAAPPVGSGGAAELVELLLIDRHEIGFTHDDMNTTTLRVVDRPAGVRYCVKDAKAIAYRDWTKKYVGRCCAMVWNGEVVSAPRFESALPGVGFLIGAFTAEEAHDVVDTLRAGPLPIVPKLVDERAAAPR